MTLKQLRTSLRPLALHAHVNRIGTSLSIVIMPVAEAKRFSGTDGHFIVTSGRAPAPEDMRALFGAAYVDALQMLPLVNCSPTCLCRED